jgi:hypothetical protein
VKLKQVNIQRGNSLIIKEYNNIRAESFLCIKFKLMKSLILKPGGHASIKITLFQTKRLAEESLKKIEYRLKYQHLNILFTPLEN